MATVEAVLALIAACIAFALLARRLRVPYAVVLVLGGMGLAFVPGLPRIALDPELALAFFLPPLLQASAYRTDWREFRAALGPILLLAVGAVLFTAFCVAAVVRLLLPEFPWAAAIALGAILAPPDAVAAAAVLGRLRVPRRINAVLEGESLINDASALVLFRFASAASLVGVGVGAAGAGGAGAAGLASGALSGMEAAAGFVLVAAGGAAIGWAVGRATLWTLPRLRDPPLEIALSFLVCFVAYAAAEAVHASGVIAVVTGGFLIGRNRNSAMLPRTRIEAAPVWRFAEFVLTSLVFVLVGLQLREVLAGLEGRSWPGLVGIAAAVSATLIASRFLWLFGTAWGPGLLPSASRREPPPSAAHVSVMAWAGMRGVVSLAAALAVPSGAPERDLTVFLAFCAILVTLVLQGTTLEWVIRRLGVEEPAREGMHPAEAGARRAAARATLAAVEARADSELDGAIAADLVAEYRAIARVLDGVAAGRSGGAAAAELAARLRIRLDALRAGREELLAHHATTPLAEEVVTALVTEMDHEEARLRGLLRAGRGG